MKLNPFAQNQEAQKPDLNVFVVYDSKSKSYRPPLLSPDEVSIRRDLESFMAAELFSAHKAPDALVTNAEDFSVFRIGTFVKATGVLSTFNPEHVFNLHEVRSEVISKGEALRQQMRDAASKEAGTAVGH